MNRQDLFNNIKQKQSFLCVGLDPDITKLPAHLLNLDDPIFEFNKQIIDTTLPYTVAYKPNLAFYESHGVKGLISFEKTIKYLKQFPDIFTIADAKRGDIGNTSEQYAKAFLSTEGFGFDSITVAPYMGEDSVKPFLTTNKWVIVLALTSNKGSDDFQNVNTATGEKFYELVIKRTTTWGTPDNMMFVVGATKAEKLQEIRQLIPEHFLLVPGVGAQGGSLSEVAKYGLNNHCGLLVNASRSILYASSGLDFAEKAKEEAERMQKEMAELLNK